MANHGVGLIACLLGALAFGFLGCVSKIGERKKCNPSALVLSLMGWSALFMLARSVSYGSVDRLPVRVIIAAIGFGITGAAAYFMFLRSIELGKVTVGWLMMNLSAGVPAVVSIWLYRERLTTLKVVGLAMGLIAMMCLFYGRIREQKDPSQLLGGR